MLLPLPSAVGPCATAASSLAALFLRVGNTPRDETIVYYYYIADDDCNKYRDNNVRKL